MRRTITIYKADGQTFETMFQAPNDAHAARSLWVFLVENLQPGHVVELESNGAQLTRPSGEKIPAPLYERIMDLEQ